MSFAVNGATGMGELHFISMPLVCQEVSKCGEESGCLGSFLVCDALINNLGVSLKYRFGFTSNLNNQDLKLFLLQAETA